MFDVVGFCFINYVDSSLCVGFLFCCMFLLLLFVCKAVVGQWIWEVTLFSFWCVCFV